MEDFERLGVFYLGRTFDIEKSLRLQDLLLYDSKDLTTHGVCVGMTGSGKTGLGISLLEEAALDGIPALVIDPKGDLGNMMLAFPSLQTSDFLPWIDRDAAARKGLSPEEYAKKTAETWRKGLAEWGQDASRIEKFQKSADITIFTPGSTAGLPLSVLRSFDAPPLALRDDSDALRDRILTAVSGLLALIGIAVDPIRSREHILISNILQNAWNQGRNLDIPGLIREIQNPPFGKIGVFDLESFFSSKERFDLAMRLNNLLASPGFSVWMQGEALDIGRLLFTPEGKPRISILSISHLSDAERMFFVTILLNELIGWMRGQPGTSSLRALLYMDEIYGYFPPTAVPPSKTPMLILLKQARAYGLGVVLATQNPVDLDYKGLSNAGTWFIGRLQTERDKERVLEGLEGVSTTVGQAFDRKNMDKILSALGHRVFLMHNVHEDQPALFQTRWVMSYLRGPLTRQQIQTLMDPRKQEMAEEEEKVLGGIPFSTLPQPSDSDRPVVERPILPSKIKEFHLPLKGSLRERESLVYRPSVLGTARLHFVNTKAKVNDWQTVSLLASLTGIETTIPWEEAAVYQNDPPETEKDGFTPAKYSALPLAALRAAQYLSWRKSLADYLYQHKTLTLWEFPALKQISSLGESEGDFRGRLAHIVHEKRDLEMEKLRKRYAPKLSRLEERLRKAEVRLGKEKTQYSHSKVQTAISMGATLLGAILGRKAASVGTVGRATTSMRGMGRAAREKADIERANQEMEVIKQKIMAMESEFKDKIEQLKEEFQPEDFDLKEFHVRPRKGDISLSPLVLVWTPWKVGEDGIAEPAFKLSSI